MPDLILLDAQMPVMDGYQFRIAQNTNERLKNIPVVVMTADSDVDMAKKMMHPEGVLLKPFQLQSILESVAHFM